MGTRSQVFIKEEGVYLYQHWDGYELPDIVRNALAKKWRWADPEYLARIIFCEMVKDHLEEETGYGIGSRIHFDIEYLVTVDTEKQEITIQHGFGDKIELTKPLFLGTFKEFVENPKTDW